jgi:hypothetical protein
MRASPRALLLAALFAALTLFRGLTSTSAQTTVGGERPPCVRVTANARFDGVGYGHWVSVENGCTTAVECDVSTDVAPTTIHVSLTPSQRREVNTFLSSPSRQFAATVSCQTR